jgi:excisionase family DNA binding protein
MDPSQTSAITGDIPRHDFLKPYEVAKLLRVSHHAVLNWIRNGHLVAINLSRGTRPLFRISKEALNDFLAAHSTCPVPKTRPIRCDRPPEGGPLDPVLGEALMKKGQAVRQGDKYYRLWEGRILRY